VVDTFIIERRQVNELKKEFIIDTRWD